MDIQLLNYGFAVVVAILLLELFKWAFKFLLNKYNPPDEDNVKSINELKAIEVLEKIGNNDLAHIYAEMQHQTRQHEQLGEKQDKMVEILTQINIKLDYLKNDNRK
jgi:hypothetical protein